MTCPLCSGRRMVFVLVHAQRGGLHFQDQPCPKCMPGLAALRGRESPAGDEAASKSAPPERPNPSPDNTPPET